MATQTYFAAHTGISYIGDVNPFDLDALSLSSTEIVLLNSDGSKTIIIGTGFAFDAFGDPIAGTINTIEYTSADKLTLYAQWTGLSDSLVGAVAAIDATPPGGSEWDSAFNFLFDGNDTGTIKAVGTFSIPMVMLGGPGADTLNGGSGDDKITGGAGNDTLNGGGGRDAANYFNAAAGVTVDLNLAGAQNTGGAGTDILIGIEDLRGLGIQRHADRRWRQ